MFFFSCHSQFANGIVLDCVERIIFCVEWHCFSWFWIHCYYELGWREPNVRIVCDLLLSFLQKSLILPTPKTHWFVILYCLAIVCGSFPHMFYFIFFAHRFVKAVKSKFDNLICLRLFGRFYVICDSWFSLCRLIRSSTCVSTFPMPSIRTSHTQCS